MRLRADGRIEPPQPVTRLLVGLLPMLRSMKSRKGSGLTELPDEALAVIEALFDARTSVAGCVARRSGTKGDPTGQGLAVMRRERDDNHPRVLEASGSIGMISALAAHTCFHNSFDSRL